MTVQSPAASTTRSLSLKARVLRAGSWSMAGLAVSQLIRLGTNLVMTRLLVPEMFGVMAIANMVTVILSLLSDMGVRQHIVQSRRGDDPLFLNTAWVVQICRGGILWVAALVVSAVLYVASQRGMLPAASVYASPMLPAVIAVSSLSALIFGFQSTNVATALRHLDQKRLIQIELVAQCVALVVMLTIGVVTRSIWALVIGGLVASATTALLSHFWMKGPQNRFQCDRAVLWELFGFGKWVFLSSAVGTFAANGDRLILGLVFTADLLGMYAIALLIVGAIEGAISKLFITVSLPTLSEVVRNDPKRLHDVYYKLRLPSDVTVLLLVGILFAAGRLLIDALYDPRYSAAGGMFEVLALTLFVDRYGVAHQIYLAVGRPHYLAVINAVRFVSIYLVVPACYYVGDRQGAIWGVALHGLVTLPFVYVFNARLGLNDFRRELLVLIALPVGFACGSALESIWQ